MPLAVDKSLGVNTDLSRLDAKTRAEALASMEEVGIRWLRQRFPWDRIEPEPDVYDWDVWDELVSAALEHGLEILAVLDGAPEWARRGEDAGNPLAPPAERREFGDFLADFATRYRAQIDYYQIWDEPNIAPHWGSREINPEAYALLLREGSIRVRASDPGATVLAAALAPTVEQGGANMSELLFLDALYRVGAAEWFDVVAAQPYDFGSAIESPADREQLNWMRMSLLRNIMEAHGDDSTAIWAVSSGIETADGDDVQRLIEQTRRQCPWLGPLMWAAWFADDPRGAYGLVRPDAEPASALVLLRAMATAPDRGWPGSYTADHVSGHYAGSWRVTAAGADIGSTGDRLRIKFWGTGIDLRVRRGEYRAFLFASVDGMPASELPHTREGLSYVGLYDPLGAVDTVPLVRGLQPGDHSAEIVAERGWGQWSIIGWVVHGDGASPGPPWLAFALSLTAAASLGLGLWLVWPLRTRLLHTLEVVAHYVQTRDDCLMLGIALGAAVILYIMEGTLPTLLALGLLALLLFARPESGLPLMALSLPVSQLGRPLLGKVFSMTEILTILTAGGWLFQSVVLRLLPEARQRSGLDAQPKLKPSWIDWWVLFLVLWSVMSLLWSEHSRVAAREFRTVILESGVFYGLVRLVVRDWCKARRVADAWIAGAVVIATVGVVQWFLGSNVITADGVWRVRGFYGSPNNLALYLGRALPLAVVMAVVKETGEGAKRSLRAWLYGAGALVMGLAIALTYSRGAWLIGVPASLLFLAAIRSRKAFFVTCAAIVVGGGAFALSFGTDRIASLLNTAEGTTFFRLQLWQSSLAMVRDHPILGVGLDNFLYHYRTYYVLPTAWEEFNLSHPHNLVLDFWLRLGLPGLLVLFGLLAAFFRAGLGRYATLAGGYARILVLGLMAGMVNLVAHGLVDNAFFLVDLAYACMLMLALVQTRTGHETAQEGDT
jgi:O-antigen ligase